VTLLSNTTSLTQSDFILAPDGSGFAVDLKGAILGTAKVAFSFGSQGGNSGGSGNVLTNPNVPAPVPLPAGIPLMASALGLLGFVRRRARKGAVA